ncbi:MAG: endonuclease/exonuclease/phosphatase family metal-dependent hydrolase [Bacteroidia bacterium]
MKKLTKGIVIFINWIVLVAVLLSYLAPFVNPKLSWIIAFFGLSFNLWILALVILLLIGLTLGTRMRIKNLIVLAIGIPFILRLVSIHPQTEGSGNFKVVSFNTYALGKYNGLNTSSDIESYLVKNDVACATLIEWRYKEGKISKKNYPYQVKIRTNDIRNSGILLVSKLPIKHSGLVPFTESSYNMAGFMDVEVNKKLVRIYGIHLETTRIKSRDYHSLSQLDFDSTYTENAKNVAQRLKTSMLTRASQVQDIRKHIDACLIPTIIMGDFNDTPQSYTYQKLKEGKKDAFVVAGSGLEATFLKPFPFFRIDYILFDDSFSAATYSSTNSIYSDHKLIFADLKIN